MEFMLNTINTKTNYICLSKKKKDVSIIIKTHGERLFPRHFILIHYCASAVMKWLFFNFTLKALRFLKITRIWLILLNASLSLHKTKTHSIQLTDNQKFNNLIWGLHDLFLLCHFWLAFYFTILFLKTQIPIQGRKAPCVKGAVTKWLRDCFPFVNNPSVTLRVPPPLTQGRLSFGLAYSSPDLFVALLGFPLPQ